MQPAQPSEKRKNLRRPISYPAFIDLGEALPLRECTLCDASQEGAQLAVAHPDSVPNEFILALSSDGAARRRCRVVWRTENQIGVEFLKNMKKVAKPSWRAAPMRPSEPEPAAEAEHVVEAPAEKAEDQVDIDSLTPR